ncbi:hypothetical protein B0H14DRAFT_2338219 [Mycena olivaceomarginata]|nr:hypothetical protein B0H14DRAFT_2338219 [Mycena olivaceomarginata]
MDSEQTNQRLGRIPLVLGMPVSNDFPNFDVPGGVVNGCSGTLKSVRYRLDAKGRRHAISCVIKAPDTPPGVIEGLADHHVVALEDIITVFRPPVDTPPSTCVYLLSTRVDVRVPRCVDTCQSTSVYPCLPPAT